METIALTFLEEQGFHLLFRNFQSLRAEIDLIGTLKDVLIFVEVRYRNNPFYGQPEESVTVSKQKKIIQCAQYFLKRYPQYQEWACRFDVIALTIKNNQHDLNWIPNAFQMFNGRRR